MIIKTTKKIFVPLFLITLVIWLVLFSTYQHELVHKTIYQTYDIESKIDMGWKTGVPTTTAIESTKNCDSNCELAHNINEVVGYTLFPVLFFIAVMLVGIFYLLWRME